MKDGLRVFDADTHVEPTAEVLDKYVDPGFRPRLADLAPYRVPVRPGNPGGAPGRHVYRYGQISYRRILGEAAPRETFTGRDTHWMGSKMPRVGVQDDQAESRVRDMEDEGTDGHFLIPTAWTSLVGHEDPALEVGIIRAFHRHMSDFSGQYPDRLKSMIVASARDVDAAVHEIREWGKSRWAVGGHAARHQRRPGRSPRARPDLARRRRTRSADRASQLHLDPALFPGLFRSVGQHLPRTAVVAPVGRDAVYRRGDRRRDLGPLSEAADRHARMRVRLAAVLGPAHGRADALCRRHRRR